MGSTFGFSASADSAKSNTERSGTKVVTSAASKRQSQNKLANTRFQKASTSQKQTQSSAQKVGVLQQQTLGAQSRQALQTMLSAITNQSNVGSLVNSITNRAQNAPADITSLIAPIVTNAQAQGAQQVGQVVQKFADAAGSSNNTLVQQLGLQEQRKVNQEVASLSASLQMKGRQQATNDQANAVKLQIGGAQTIANALKGSLTTGTSTEKTNQLANVLAHLSANGYQNEVSNLMNILNANSKTNTAIQSTSYSHSSDMSGSAGLSLF